MSTAILFLAVLCGPPVALEDPSGEARAALEGFVEVGVQERRERARLVRHQGEAECVDGVRGILARDGEPDAEVRLVFAEFLARADLGDARAAERARALEGLAAGDPAPAVVAASVEGLASMRHPEAGLALDRLVDELARPVLGEVVAALVNTARGREAIVRRVREFAEGTSRPTPDVLGRLLSVYGRAIVDRPGGGERVRDVAPLLAGVRHENDSVRVGALLGLESLISRCTQLLEFDRCSRVLSALEEAGWVSGDLDYRRALVALRFTADPGAAIEPARRLLPRAEDVRDRGERLKRFYGTYLEGIAHAGAGNPERSGPLLSAASDTLAELARDRRDLEPLPGEPSELRLRQAVDNARHLAMVDLQRAVALLLAGRLAADEEVLGLLRAAHVRLLEAQILAERWGVPIGCGIDAILDHDLGPRPLLYENTANPNLSRERGIELLESVGRGWASLAPTEMPGFEPLQDIDPALADPLRDDERFRLLLELESARIQRLLEEALGPGGDVQLGFRVRQIADQKLRKARDAVDAGADRAEAFRFLLERRAPSRLALWLARDLRLEARAVESRAYSERMLEDLDASGLGDPWLEADIGMVLASSYTEEDRPAEAEAVLLGVLDDLESLVRQLEVRRNRARESGDDSGATLAASQIRQTELRIADCLVSLAVNANVRMNEQEKALAYFERAFELDQRDFMRGLLACYRARSGRFEEARAELREVAPAPSLYYNMACTFALLSEPELALEFLRRDFEENLQSRGALARQKDWARGDPVLANLRDDPRFVALVE